MPATFKTGGVHPPQNKFTASAGIVDAELPRSVSLMLIQHIGAPAVAVVKPGDRVCRGECVAEAQTAMSVPVHTPISGTVRRIAQVLDAEGRPVKAIIVEASDEDHLADMSAPAPQRRDPAEVEALKPREIVGIVRSAGLVGLGGAAFPTAVKLSPPRDAVIDTLVVNGAECEPYLTCDDALMRSHAGDIVSGVVLAAKAVGAERVLIGIELNKPEAIEAMRQASAETEMVEVVPLKVKYPQGGEKQLIQALTGREVPTAALPASVGCVVMNVATAYALHRAVWYGEPLMGRVVTVTGRDVEGGNYFVAQGTRISDLLRLAIPSCDQLRIGKIISGGPMMGRSIDNLDAPLKKSNSGFVLIDADSAVRRPVEPCVRCARCVDVCPMGLEPYLISTLSRLQRFDEAKDESILNCVECGSCQYICPSSRPLLDFIRLGKGVARTLIKKKS